MKKRNTLLTLRLISGLLLITILLLQQFFPDNLYFNYIKSTPHLYAIIVSIIVLNSLIDPVLSFINKAAKRNISYITSDLPYYISLFVLIIFVLLAQRYLDAIILTFVFFMKFFIWNIYTQLNLSLDLPYKPKSSNYEKIYSKLIRYLSNALICIGFILFLYGAFVSPYPLSETLTYTGISLILISTSRNSFIFISYMFDQLISIFIHTSIFVKNKTVIEDLSKATTIIFNKGNTLTTEEYKLKYAKATNMPPTDLLQLVAYGTYYSDHPLANAIKEAASEVDPSIITDFRPISGHGTSSHVMSKILYVGNYKLMCQMGFTNMFLDTESTLLHIASSTEYLGCIALENTVEKTARQAIEELTALNINNTHIFTGDRYITTEKLATTLGIKEIHCDLHPIEKATILASIQDSLKSNEKCIFVAGSETEKALLAASNIGILFNADSHDYFLQSVVIHNSDLTLIPFMLKLSRRVVNKVRSLTIINLFSKLLLMPTVLLFPNSSIYAMLFLLLTDLSFYFICKKK